MKTSHHASEEEIEKYSLGDLSEPEAARFEEHLLICQSCQNRVAESDQYVAFVQSASARRRLEDRKPRHQWILFPRWLPAFATAGVLLFLGVLGLQWLHQRNSGSNLPAIAVTLTAFRGPELTKAPERRTLALQLDFAGLPAEPWYRLDVVDAHGNPVWHGTVNAADSHGFASIPGIPRGTYFVRAYSSSGKLLREYGLEIEGR